MRPRGNWVNFYEQQMKFEQAVYRYGLAIKANPHSTKYLKLLAWVCMKKGDYESAEKYFRQLVAKSPESPDAHGDLGIILSQNKNYFEAVSELKVALKTDSTDARYLNALGSAVYCPGENGNGAKLF